MDHQLNHVPWDELATAKMQEPTVTSLQRRHRTDTELTALRDEVASWRKKWHDVATEHARLTAERDGALVRAEAAEQRSAQTVARGAELIAERDQLAVTIERVRALCKARMSWVPDGWSGWSIVLAVIDGAAPTNTNPEPRVPPHAFVPSLWPKACAYNRDDPNLPTCGHYAEDPIHHV